MKVWVNGEEREVPPEATVRALIELLGWVDGPVAVERNGDIVPRREHASTLLAEADRLEIVHFVGGG